MLESSKYHDPVFHDAYQQHFEQLEEPVEAEDSVAAEAAPAEAPKQGWGAWGLSLVSGTASSIASVVFRAEEARPQTPLELKKEEISELREKLSKLEKRAAKAEEAMKNPEASIAKRCAESEDESEPITQSEIVSERLHAEQELLACRRLIISVELKIAYGLREAHELAHTTDSEAYRKLDEWVVAFEGHCKDEGRNLLEDEAKFTGIGRIYSDLALRKWEASPEHSDLIERIRDMQARSGIVSNPFQLRYDFDRESKDVSVERRLHQLKEKYDLDGSLPQIDAQLTPLDHARFKVAALQGQEHKIAEIMRLKGTFTDGAMTLDGQELAQLKLQHLEVQTYLAEAAYDLLGIQEEAKRVDLDSEIGKLTAARDVLIQKKKKHEDEHDVVQQLVSSADLHNLSISPEIRGDAAKLADEIDALEQGILVMEQRILDLESEITSIRRDMIEQVKAVGLIRARKAAQEDVNALLSGGKSYSEYLGKAVSRGIDVLSSVTRLQRRADEHYVGQWEEKPWGKLIKDQPDGMFQNFTQTISDFKKEVVALEAKKLVLQETRKQVEDDLEELSLHPELFEDIESDKEKLLKKLATLDQAIQAATAGLDDARILLRAAFLERLIAEVSTRTATLNQKQAQLTAKHGIISTLEQRLKSNELVQLLKNDKLNEKERAELQAQLDARADGANLELSEEDRSTLQKQLDARLNEAKKLGEEISVLKTEIAALKKGYEAQKRTYERLPRGEHLLLDQLQNYFSDRLKEMLTFGAVGAGYKSIKDFDRECQFATHGYQWQKVLTDELSNTRGYANSVDFFNAQVRDFLVFADAYPDLAQGIAVDFALTLNVLQDKGPLENLLSGLRASAYTNRLLGELGRDVEADPELSPELYQQVAKYRALADLAKWGPMAASMPGVLEGFGAGFMEGGFWGGLIGGARAGVSNSVSVTITRDVLRNMSNEQTPVILAIAAVANGESVASVIDEQKNLELIRIGGDVRRAINDPAAAKSAFRRFWHNQRIAFQNDGALKKMARVAAFAVPVVAGAGLGVATFFALPVVAPAVLILAIVGAALTGLLAGSAGTRFLLSLPGMNSYKAVVARQHVQSKANDLKIARDGMLENLRSKRVLRQEVRKETDHALLKELRNATPSPLTQIEQDLLRELNARLEQQKAAVSGRELTPKEIQNLFFEVVGKRLSHASTPLSDAVDNLMAAQSPQMTHLTDQQRYAIKQGVMDTLTQRLVDDWFKQALDPAFEGELFRLVEQYQTPEQFEDAQRTMQVQLNTHQIAAREELASAVGSMELPAEANARMGGNRSQLTKNVTSALGLAPQAAAASPIRSEEE